MKEDIHSAKEEQLHYKAYCREQDYKQAECFLSKQLPRYSLDEIWLLMRDQITFYY